MLGHEDAVPGLALLLVLCLQHPLLRPPVFLLKLYVLAQLASAADVAS